jgi:hypothetical protein
MRMEKQTNKHTHTEGVHAGKVLETKRWVVLCVQRKKREPTVGERRKERRE